MDKCGVMCKVFLKKGEGRTLAEGGCWVFDNEIDRIDGSYQNGDIVSVYAFNDYFLGYGYINDNSKIRIRVLSRDINEEVNDNFFRNKLLKAYNYRKDIIEKNSYRLVFSDADNLPGLVVDKFEDVLVVEIDTLGMDVRKNLIVKMLLEIYKQHGETIRGIYERSDARVRTLEGLDRVKGFLTPEFDTNVIIDEYGVKICVDIVDGQKTGYFLDQKANHFAIRKLCKNKKVLDCFTHTGGFALSAAKVAREVVGVDISDLAINQAKENAKLNNYTNVNFIVADVFDYLPMLVEQKQEYDVVILDPPAFTKTSSSVKQASKGYREINYRAMKLIKDGGYLVTCSCSEYMNKDLFMIIINEAAKSAHKTLKLVEVRTQDSDHPILIGNNVLEYLKCIIVQVNQKYKKRD